MIQVGIIGATGYTGGELARLLIGHPHAELVAVTSRQYEGRALTRLFPGLMNKTELIFRAALDDDELPDVVFMATPNGVAMEQVPGFIKKGVKVIDLSADFRIKDAALWARWYGQEHTCPDLLDEAVYGLPEIYRDDVRSANLIANPGCYPTSVLLGYAPLLRAQIIAPDSLIIDAKSGVSGAGRQAKTELLLSEVSGSFKAYGASGHRHFPEIFTQLKAIGGEDVEESGFEFTPHLIPMTRGIFSTLYFGSDADVHALYEVLATAWRNEPFVAVLPPGAHPQTRTVRGTNMCHLSVHKRDGGRVGKVLSVIDNLIKGASGQAIQNFNLMCGFDETAGLQATAIIP